MKLYKAKGQGIFVNNPLNVIQMKQLVDNALLVKYRDGDEVVIDEYNIIADPKAKMEKVSEIISALPKANGRIENINSINDIQIGDIIEIEGDIIVVDNDVLDGIKNSSVLSDLDILGDGSCIACYTFDNESAVDLSGNYNGTWYGTEQYDNGKFGKAAKFDGNSYIEATILNETTMSFSLWIYANNIDNHMSVFSQNGNDGSDHCRGIYIKDSKIGLWSRDKNGTWRDITYDIFVNKWIHLVFIQNDNVIKGYVNNILFDSFSMNGTVTFYDKIRLGRYFSSEHYFNGFIDQVRIFNKALTEEEVQKVYQETSKSIKKII